MKVNARRIAGLCAAVAGLVLVFAGPAAATADRAAPPSSIRVVATKITVAGANGESRVPLVSCSGVSITRGAYTGAVCYGTNILDVLWSDGRWQTFVVGTTSSNNIYNIWQRWAGDSSWSGWAPVAGNGTAINGVWLADDSPLTIKVVGTDSRYCNTWNPNWSGWYNC
ncbi:hypothetical protein F4553_000402 [Allocatelliglobosispora scoriae]|uniref:Uncharacterized protein n=1 Tax=Allocatelliglobosispora scoriae TaxID=643052 RepID=A0A841BIZ2_9ACTN|nr:hypothetical protein [Allocatelliglobosispora scoriae]MBB5867023.1 hypothetical protein [Allocatelliglobosispora scoriae]